MDIISALILGSAIVLVCLVCSVLFFILYLGPRKIIKSVENLREINQYITTNKRQASENVAIAGRLTKQLELIEEYINILHGMIKNLNSNFENESTINNRTINIKNELEELENIKPLSIEVFEEKTIYDDESYDDKLRREILEERPETQVNIKFSDVEKTENNFSLENEIDFINSDHEESRVKILGDEMTKDQAKKEGYSVWVWDGQMKN